MNYLIGNLEKLIESSHNLGSDYVVIKICDLKYLISKINKCEYRICKAETQLKEIKSLPSEQCLKCIYNKEVVILNNI